MTSDGPTYSRFSGLVFLFNLILGTGALALPKAFQEAGWLLTSILLALIAFMSFIPATFIVEAMAICNALKPRHEMTRRQAIPQETSDDTTPLTGEPIALNKEDFEITNKFELADIVKLVGGRVVALLLYLNIVVYIYGDLSVYAAAVSKSLRDVTCNSTCEGLAERDPCWSPGGLSRATIYRIYLAIFACVLGPFFFCNVTKTQWLQMCTITARWIALILMSSIAIARIFLFPEVPRLSLHWPLSTSALRQTDTPVRPNPPIAVFTNLPKAFGVCVYAFMCHHSLPGVLTPIKDKRKLFSSIMLTVYVVIYLCYLVLAGTAVAAFNVLQDLYTLNFVPTADLSLRPRWPLLMAEYFLALYPVFALSSSFPVMGTTLANNLLAMLLRVGPSGRRFREVIRWIVPLLALIPPIIIAMAVNDVGELVGVTGAFAGSGIMYIFPSVLVFLARRALAERVAEDRAALMNDESVTTEDPSQPAGGQVSGGAVAINPYQSPFAHTAWIGLLLVWSVSCVFVVALNRFGVF